MGKKRIERISPESLHLPCTGVDTHAHLDSKALMPQLDAVIERATRAGVAHIGQVFLSPEAYEQGQASFTKHPHVFFLLGIHPCHAHEFSPNVIDSMRAFFKADTRLRAVGEVGLDLYWKACPLDVQENLFRLQARLALELNVPLVLHSRDATAQSIAVLESEGLTKHPVLWHCFQGDAIDYLDTILQYNWEISIPGIVTYTNNQVLRDAARDIPLERLHIETDCPYLSPMPWRGTENEPALVVFTAQAIAQSREMDLLELWTQCGKNAVRFFSL